MKEYRAVLILIEQNLHERTTIYCNVLNVLKLQCPAELTDILLFGKPKFQDSLISNRLCVKFQSENAAH